MSKLISQIKQYLGFSTIRSEAAASRTDYEAMYLRLLAHRIQRDSGDSSGD
jgi:hypothetical protein